MANPGCERKVKATWSQVPGRIGRKYACSSHSLQDLVQLPLLHSSEPPSCLSRPFPSSGKDRDSQVSWEWGWLWGADAPHRLQSTLLPAEAPCSEFCPKLRLPRSTTDPSSKRCSCHDEAAYLQLPTSPASLYREQCLELVVEGTLQSDFLAAWFGASRTQWPRKQERERSKVEGRGECCQPQWAIILYLQSAEDWPCPSPVPAPSCRVRLVLGILLGVWFTWVGVTAEDGRPEACSPLILLVCASRMSVSPGVFQRENHGMQEGCNT